MTAQWNLRIVGESSLVQRDGSQCTLSSKPKRFAVLLFLALAAPGQRVRRDVLLAMFWPELDGARARNALRATLHQLRQTLGAEAILGSGEDELCLNPAAVHVDLTDLLAAIDSGDLSAWLGRPSLELVPGLHVSDAAPFEQWLDTQRQNLTTRLVRAAWVQANAHAISGDLARAVIAGYAATRLNRADESGVRRLIALLDQKGDRALALAEFESFERWLAEEFDATPAPETIALVQRVRERTQSGADRDAPARRPDVSRTDSAAGVVLPAAPSPPAPNAVRRVPWRPLGVAALALLAVVAGTTVGRLHEGGMPNGGANLPVAIAPFRSEVADSAVAYFAPALGESVADELQSSGVIPYTASRAATAGDSGVSNRLRQFGAHSIVSGILRGTRDSLVVLVTIARADDGELLGRATLHGSERGLLFLRDTLVATIARATGATVKLGSERHLPVPAAYQLSLNAAWLLGRRSRAELLRARDLYVKALELDPAWADLWLGLSRVSGSLAYRHYIDFRGGMIASEHAADEALARAPDDGRALIERSLARLQLGDRSGAAADAKRASVLDTTDAPMQSLIGTWWQWSSGHLDSALFYTRRAQRLAPWDRQIRINILQIVACMPDSAATIREAENVLDVDPNEPEALETLAWTFTRFGRWDDATRAYLKAHDAHLPMNLAARAGNLTGEARFRATVRAIREAEFAEQRMHPPPTPPLLESRIALYEDLGMRDSSLAALSSVVDSLDAHHANMMCAPNLSAFRHDPRARAIVRRRGWTAAEFDREP